MKKKTTFIITILLAIASVFALAACSGTLGGAVNYYGCPNSKRVDKLNTRKYIKL